MVKIEGFPILLEEECQDMFNSDFGFFERYFLKPKYEWLPDFGELNEEEKTKYKFKNLKEGMYLVGMEIITENWVDVGYCNYLLEQCGLVLDSANVMEMKGSRGSKESLICLTFKHIILSVNSLKITVS